MNRNMINKLAAWKENGCTHPFFLCGTKGTGKTYLALDFAKEYFPQYLYVNFERNKEASDFFCQNLLSGVPLTDILALYFEAEGNIWENTLLILDEVTFCPPILKVLTSYREMPVLALSSLISEEVKKNGFEFARLFPLRFDEFLDAVGNSWYIDIIRGHFQNNKAVPDIVHQELLALFEEYLVVGGMPDAVNEYLNGNGVSNVAEVQNRTYLAMQSFLKSCSEETDYGKAMQVLSVLTTQLERENKKFRLNTIRKGVTYSLYEESLDILEKCGIVYRLNQDRKDGHFKLYLPDVGVLTSEFFGKNNDEIRRAQIENFVMQTLLENNHYEMSFWESEAQAKLSFLLTKNGTTTPVELRTSTSSKSKSIGVYLQKDSGRQNTNGLRIGPDNFCSTDVIKTVPYYAAFCL